MIFQVMVSTLNSSSGAILGKKARRVRPMNARGNGNSQFMQIVEICAIRSESQRAMPRLCTTITSGASGELSGASNAAASWFASCSSRLLV